MPNGRSGGFVIESTDLKQVLQAVSDDLVVGQLASRFDRQAVKAAEVTRLIEECPHDRIDVEEHDRTFYIIQISDQPTLKWVAVFPESPIFDELRRRHAQWMVDHPGWKGWIVF